MIGNNSYYKGSDILNEEYRNRMLSYFNPYEYNLDSDMKDKDNIILKKMKSDSHKDRFINKNIK